MACPGLGECGRRQTCLEMGLSNLQATNCGVCRYDAERPCRYWWNVVEYIMTKLVKVVITPAHYIVHRFATKVAIRQ